MAACFNRIVIATDKFKGSMTAAQAAEAIRDGILEGIGQKMDNNGEFPERGIPKIIPRPMADGGEGSMGVMERVLLERDVPYEKIFIDSTNHLGTPVMAPVLLFSSGNNTPSAFVEMASVCGLNMIPHDRRNLLRSTTYGLGTVLRECIETHGVRNILMAIGGSGTNDGGFGMLAALGWSFSNSSPFRNKDIPTFISGIEAVSDRSVTDICPHLRQTSITVATDVSSPLLGPLGATTVYGPQKGCRKQDIPVFESALENWVKVIGVPDFPGAGAAGGTGYALKAVLGAGLTAGWQIFSAMLHLEEEIASADLVITGEGRFDKSSLTGKLPAGIATLCRRYGKPIWVVTGLCQVPESEYRSLGINRVFELSALALTDELPLSDAPAIIRRIFSSKFHNHTAPP